MRIVYLILWSAFLLVHSSVKAQDNAVHFPVFSIRANPFSFVETDAGIQIGVGYHRTKRWAATFDPMYIFYTPVRNLFTNERDRLSGLKIRSDVRYYFNDLYFGNGFRLLRPFLGPEIHFKNVTTHKSTNFGVNCVNQQCDYYMTTDYREIKSEMGVAVKAGFNRPLSTRLALEVYGGLGVRFIHIKEKDIPLGGSFLVLPVHDGVIGARDGEPTPYAPIGLKLVYSIYK